MKAWILATLAVTNITESYGDLLPEIKAAKESHFLDTTLQPTFVDVSITDQSQWRSIHATLTDERRICMHMALHNRMTSLFHDNPQSSHYGAPKSTKLVSRDFYSPGMESEIWKYIAVCVLCHQIKSWSHACYWHNMPLSLPSHIWEGLTMDFIANLQVSMALRYTGILLIVDHLTRMAIYLLCRKDIDSLELAQIFFQHLIWKCGVPDTFTTDRGKQFTRWFCDRVCSHLRINHQLSITFHPQTDSHNKWLNQTMEQYLQALCNYEQDNLVDMLQVVEFVYTNSIHTSSLMTPIGANYKYYPMMQFKPSKNPSFRPQVQADLLMAGVEETHWILWENITEV